MTIIKVQMPIDQARARAEGAMYIDHSNPDMLVYDEARTNVGPMRDERLRKMMLDAEDGLGYVKAYVYATWRAVPRRWEIDYERGFAPMQDW